MATNTKDNLQAHRFMNRRVRAALLEGDAESTTRPLAGSAPAPTPGSSSRSRCWPSSASSGCSNPADRPRGKEPGAFIVERGDRRPVRLSGRGAASGAELLLGQAAARRPVARGHRVGAVAGIGPARRRPSASRWRPIRCRMPRTSSAPTGRCARSANARGRLGTVAAPRCSPGGRGRRPDRAPRTAYLVRTDQRRGTS